MDCALKRAQQEETSLLGTQILGQLQDNLKIAKRRRDSDLRDTGMAVIFLEIGQEVHFDGGDLEAAVQ